MPDFKPVVFENFVFMEPLILGYQNLIKPRTNNFGGVYFDATLLIPAEHSQRAEFAALLKKVRGGLDACKHLPVEKGEAYATRMDEWAASKDKERNYDWAKPYTLLSVRGAAEYPPRLAVWRNGDWYVPEAQERQTVLSAFYPGARVVADLNICAYSSQGGTITVYVNDIRSLNKGDRIKEIGGGKDGRFGSASAFAKYVGTVSDHNPTAGLDAAEDDDEIPF